MDGTAPREVRYRIEYEVRSDFLYNSRRDDQSHFSQVESDAFQVQVNQRFPNFFPKATFFMEAWNVQSSATGGDGNMVTALHTRKINDPIWGTKVTGTAGNLHSGFSTQPTNTPMM
jgi:hypothetical protein